MTQRRILRTAGALLLVVGAIAALGALLVRDQISRHRRNLFSPHPLRRLAALGYLAGHEASVDAVRLLRDFIAWEPRPLLRRRAAQILERMERRLSRTAATAGEVAG
jgi:hypothetical protein